MTYVDNGLAWWQALLLAFAGGMFALLIYNGAGWLLDWWVGWRKQYKARHRADPIEDATEEPDNRPAIIAQHLAFDPVDFDEGVDPYPQPKRPDPGEPENADSKPTYESWGSTPLGWAANGRYIHRADCTRMTTGKPITVWSEDAARKWAEATKPRLTGCPHCNPFNTPEPAEAS